MCSEQKEEALEAVRELVEGVVGGDEAALQQSIETLDQFTASVLIVDKDDGADEDEVQEAIDTLSESGANVTFSAALVTSSDEEDDDGGSSGDDYDSVAQFQEGDVSEDDSDVSAESLSPHGLLAQELQARRGSLATVSKEEESVRLREQEARAERACGSRRCVELNELLYRNNGGIVWAARRLQGLLAGKEYSIGIRPWRGGTTGQKWQQASQFPRREATVSEAHPPLARITKAEIS
jgi:hypothetical protein